MDGNGPPAGATYESATVQRLTLSLVASWAREWAERGERHGLSLDCWGADEILLEFAAFLEAVKP